MVNTPAKPTNIPMTIHLVIFAQRESQIVKMGDEQGYHRRNDRRQAAADILNDHVSNPFAIHSNRMPWKEIFFNASQPGKE
jgi:hypothetical protein